jgi:Family of unknown function (DUF5343)
MAVTAEKPAPYATAGSILDIIDRYRSRGLPSPVDGEVLARAGIAQSLIPRTLQALQTLDLIDSETGAPTQTFEGLRLASESEYRQRLEDWLKGAYADVFAFVDLTKDDEGRVRDAFRSYQPIGQQDRMVLLFQGLCTAAGLIKEKPDSARTPPAARPRSASTPPLRRAAIPKQASKHAPSKHHLIPELPRPLAGLLESLPANGEGWTKDARERFMTTFGTVLDFCIPVVKNAPASTKENGGQD